MKGIILAVLMMLLSVVSSSAVEDVIDDPAFSTPNKAAASDWIDDPEFSSAATNTKTRFVMVAVALDGAITAYADPSTIRKSGKKVKMWHLFDYKTAMALSTGKPYMSSQEQPYMSLQEQSEFDCKEEQSRRLYSTFYSGNMRRGEVVGVIETPGNWSPVSPDSMNKALWKIACGKRRL